MSNGAEDGHLRRAGGPGLGVKSCGHHARAAMLEAMQNQVLAVTKRGSLELRMLELDGIAPHRGVTSAGAATAGRSGRSCP